MHDVIVIGGSFAGHSAAMQLARASKSVLLIDSGSPRNRFAEGVHGFLGQDGRPPRDIMMFASTELLAYPSAATLHAEVTSVVRMDKGFRLNLSNGDERQALRLVLATGVSDDLPPIPGLKERWGKTVLHCPYCHGYEVKGRALGVIANNPMSAHHAALISDWGPVTYFTQGPLDSDEATHALLAKRNVAIEQSPIIELFGTAPQLEAVRLDDGRKLAIDVLFTASRTRMSSPLAEQLGCAFEEGPTGPYIKVDLWGLTSVPHVYAAGDATTPMHNATLAAGSGVIAGVGAHQSLVFE